MLFSVIAIVFAATGVTCMQLDCATRQNRVDSCPVSSLNGYYSLLIRTNFDKKKAMHLIKKAQIELKKLERQSSKEKDVA
jgi:hypothetical protein